MKKIPRIYAIEDDSETVYRLGELEKTLQIEYDDNSKKQIFLNSF